MSRGTCAGAGWCRLVPAGAACCRLVQDEAQLHAQSDERLHGRHDEVECRGDRTQGEDRVIPVLLVVVLLLVLVRLVVVGRRGGVSCSSLRRAGRDYLDVLGHDNHDLGCCRLVRTGAGLVRTGTDWYALVRTGTDW